MEMHYAWQFLALDDENNPLFPFDGQVYVDMPLLKRIMDSHEEHMIWEANRLQELGIASMSADWSAMWVCFCGLEDEASSYERNELKNFYMERMASILSQIKDRFNGEVYVGENIIWNDSRVFNEVDGIVVYNNKIHKEFEFIQAFLSKLNLDSDQTFLTSRQNHESGITLPHMATLPN